jgi:hypothetical protein
LVSHPPPSQKDKTKNKDDAAVMIYAEKLRWTIAHGLNKQINKPEKKTGKGGRVRIIK